MNKITSNAPRLLALLSGIVSTGSVNDLTIRRWFCYLDIVGWCFRSLNFLSLYRILLNQKTSFDHIQQGVTV